MAPLNWDQLNNIEAETIAERIDYWYDQINQVRLNADNNHYHLGSKRIKN